MPLTRDLRPLDRDNGQTGILAPSARGFNAANVALTANRAYVARFVPSRDMTVTLIAFSVEVAAGADDACDVGIYDASYNRIVSSGATTGKLNSQGVKTVTIASTALVAGVVYYAAISTGTQGGSAGQLGGANMGSSRLGQLFGAAVGKLEADFQNTAHTLPATLTGGGGITTVPQLAVRES